MDKLADGSSQYPVANASDGTRGMESLGRWDPLTPEQVTERLSGLAAPWWIAGGWALDLFIGRQTRAHGDIDIALFRQDADAFRAHLAEWELAVAADGALTPWPAGTAFPAAAHQLWARKRGHDAWQLEVLFEERSGDRWVYRRHPQVGLRASDIGRRTSSGIPYLRPEIQLLYKSKGARAVDESDLIALLPQLDAAQRATLVAWLYTTAPTHRWLERLRDRP
jgi:hypothetical protein